MTDKAGERLRHLPARQGRLGREHGVPDRDGQFLRRALVRREVEAAVRHARVEEDARLLCRPDEGRRPSRRLLERLQREPGAVQRGQVRHVDRRHGRRRLRDRSEAVDRSPTRSASRWRPTTGLGKRGNWLWAWSLAVPAGSQKIDAAEKFIAWATSKHYTELVAAQDGWAHVPPGTRTSLYENADYLKAAPFAQMTLELDQLGRSDPSDRQAGALRRRAVRRDPRVPGHRAPPSARTSRRRSPDR